MRNLQITLHRSHFNHLAIAAADVAAGRGDGPNYNETGWFTRFDGGGNTKTPGLVVAIYGDAALGFKPDEHAAEFWAVVHLSYWAQEPGREGNTFFRMKNPKEAPDAERDGLSWLQEVGNDLWEQVAESAVPEMARKVLEKCVKSTLGLFGQGRDFFGIPYDVGNPEDS